MNAAEAERFWLSHFRAPAIRGDLQPSRTYEVVEPDPAHLKFRTRKAVRITNLRTFQEGGGSLCCVTTN